ncbi:hypothetical protein [Renibacterium salmoninarum]|uniref:hypothetical protein n=1 Tax=Renibacterium salmoninarum TaxID=1646 RepID=UPI0011AB8544|nr:hypothetical protein [Renibacterium salmoninarum]
MVVRFSSLPVRLAASRARRPGAGRWFALVVLLWSVGGFSMLAVALFPWWSKVLADGFGALSSYINAGGH